MTAEAPVLEITLPPLHTSQREIAKDPARFKVVCCGRRWGKTMLGTVAAMRGRGQGTGALTGGRIFWVAPTVKQANEGWAYLTRVSAPIPGARVHLADQMITYSGGGRVEMRTEGGEPDNLRGAGLDGVVLDEAALLKHRSWDQILRPALADKQGWAMFISTPQHFNWFFDLYEGAETDSTGTWGAWQYPTWDNPFIPEGEIDASRRDMADEDFDQEYGASFTAVGGAIFKGLSGNRPFFLRSMPANIELARSGVGMDWGTTKQHQSAVVAGGRMASGTVWIRSAWLSESGSSDEWREEAVRCKRDYGANFARVDRSQSSELDRIAAKGFQADRGTADVATRIGEMISLVRRKAIFFDSAGPGVVALYNRLCAYHRDEEGKVVEEEDDDVDAVCYLVSELVNPRHIEYPAKVKSAYAESSRWVAPRI